MTVSCSLTSFAATRTQAEHASNNPSPPRAKHWSLLWRPKVTDAVPSVVSPTLAPPTLAPPTSAATVLPHPMDLKVAAATRRVLHRLGITSRDKFIAWREANGKKGMLSRSPFFGLVKDISGTHWNTLAAPKYSCAAAYERALPGYKTYCGIR